MIQNKKAQVIMLPTEEKSIIGKEKLSFGALNSLRFNSPRKNLDFQQLYIISDDEIKECDYIYHPLDKKVVFCDKEHFEILQSCSDKTKYGYKKIIATTDLLCIKDNGGNWKEDDYSPKPSQEFIKYYIEEYNKGNVIVDVLVSYETEMGYSCRGECGICDGGCGPISNLKINSDNTIVIKTLKDNYSREEVFNLMKLSIQRGVDLESGNCDFNNYGKDAQWINEKL